MISRKLFCLSLAITLSPFASAMAATVQFVPSKDNTLIQRTGSNPQYSNGQGDMVVGRTGQDGSGPDPVGGGPTISIRRGLVHFNVSSIPAGSTITSAKLTLRDVQGNNGDQQIELHRMLQDWGEGSSFQAGGQGAPSQQGDASWLYSFYNEALPSASTVWGTPGSPLEGGNFSPTVTASTIIYDQAAPGPVFPPLSSFTWSSTSDPAMIADVQFWLDNPGNNFGWLLKNDNEGIGQTTKRLSSRESGFAPVLEITYVPEPSSILLLASGCMLTLASTKILSRRTRLPNPISG